MRRSDLPAAFLVLSVAAYACSSDKTTGPQNPLAKNLRGAADSASNQADPRVAMALYAASAIVDAGGRVGSVQLTVDSAPQSYSAVAFRLTYSKAACDQMQQSLMSIDMPTDSSGNAWMCAPTQTLIAWQGDDVKRVAMVVSDTGSSQMDPNSFALYTSFNFWAEMYDRENRKDWWLTSGTQSTGKVSDGGPCKSQSVPQAGMDFNCRLSVLRHSFDLVLAEYPVFEYDSVIYVDSGTVRPGAHGKTLGDTGWTDTTTWRDSIPSDSGWTWDPPPLHTISMRTTQLSGITMEITRLDFGIGMGRAIRASAIKSGSNRIRLQRARRQ